ncbi:hypothetical protein BDZ91DRAFT_748622 [Kalaharituber pfeilii]|nr:hypothetical protein BDZ91DRAFT_748622 [Kalaharituber pfeilii]
MHISTASILAPLLFLEPALVSAIPWPFNSNPQSPAAKYWPPGTKPPDEKIEELKSHHERRSLTYHAPTAVKKMLPDEGEKFYHYDDPFALNLPEYFSLSEIEHVPNIAIAHPKSPHSAGLALQQLSKRQFSCATNNYACDSINAPAYCCRVDEACIRVEDTGHGTVGCCPNGQKCVGSLNGCNDDQVTCSRDQGGGCCNFGYKCSANGCVPDDSSGKNQVPSTEGAQTTQACSSGFYPCPSTLAGGCCATGRACGVDICPATETEPLAPPVPTDTCPTGFYSCAARFNGGCCRIGRDCGLTNCPARTTGPTTAGDDIKTTATSIYVPTGNCQTGWHSCPPSFNGGCCPSGYDCGVTNCPANTLAGILPAETKRMPVRQNSQNSGTRAGAVVFGDVRSFILMIGFVIGINLLA